MTHGWSQSQTLVIFFLFFPTFRLSSSSSSFSSTGFSGKFSSVHRIFYSFSSTEFFGEFWPVLVPFGVVYRKPFPQIIYILVTLDLNGIEVLKRIDGVEEERRRKRKKKTKKTKMPLTHHMPLTWHDSRQKLT